MHHPTDDHDLGLGADLQTLARQSADRRRALRWLLAGGAAAGGALPLLAGCGGGGSNDGAATTTGSTTTTGTTTGTTGTTTTTPTTCSVIPEETAGPYPGDGSNGANALVLSGIVRSDITASIAGASGVAAGVPLTVTLQLVNTNGSCTSLAGYAIYLWHCDALGRYSMYSSGVTAENYLRGVQSTDAAGLVSFSSIFPACYDGRWPHMHFEVYPTLDAASSADGKIATSQLALPEDACAVAYATAGYESSVSTFSRVSLTTDNVFSDGAELETPTVTGNADEGFVITLTVTV